MLKILELRARAQAALGDRSTFAASTTPCSTAARCRSTILTRRVDEWIAASKSRAAN